MPDALIGQNGIGPVAIEPDVVRQRHLRFAPIVQDHAGDGIHNGMRADAAHDRPGDHAAARVSDALRRVNQAAHRIGNLAIEIFIDDVLVPKEGIGFEGNGNGVISRVHVAGRVLRRLGEATREIGKVVIG